MHLIAESMAEKCEADSEEIIPKKVNAYYKNKQIPELRFQMIFNK